MRLWPGVVAGALLWLVWLLLPAVAPAAGPFAVLGGVGFGLVMIIWWLFFSRVRWPERIGAVVLMTAGLLAVSRVVHVSISNGLMGMMPYVLGIPVLASALVLWAVVARRLEGSARAASMGAIMALAFASLAMVRTEGVTGDGISELHWRWTKTPEERLLAQGPDAAPLSPPPLDVARRAPSAAPATPASDTAPAHALPAEGTSPAPTLTAPGALAEWPGFRGTHRDGIVRGVRIDTDWARRPPVQIWRRPIGPGWSSFAVSGDLFYTQEQRGDEETVACYRVSTGQLVWRHRDQVRFWESNGGAGPRATPTLSGTRVYTFGATGILNALEAATGAVAWSRNAKADTNRQVPDWGFASSPLVVDDIVIVAVSGTLAAYDASTGSPRWVGPQHGGSYSSPHLVTRDDAVQVVVLSGAGATSVDPRDGHTLWEYAWEGSTIVQPALTADGDILLSTASAMGGTGVRRVTASRGESGWTVSDRWASTGLKPYFNDMVVHKGHAFGFDGSILASIDLANGSRAWKGGRYGNGQMLLLADQDVLLVLSEEGDLALVSATADRFTELARIPALTGKTWNHPVVVGDVLLLRNGEEMAAFRLPRSTNSTPRRDAAPSN